MTGTKKCANFGGKCHRPPLKSGFLSKQRLLCLHSNDINSLKRKDFFFFFFFFNWTAIGFQNLNNMNHNNMNLTSITLPYEANQ